LYKDAYNEALPRAYQIAVRRIGTAIPSGKHNCLKVRHSVSKPQLYTCQILDHNFKKKIAFRYVHDAGEFFLVLKFNRLPRLLEVIAMNSNLGRWNLRAGANCWCRLPEITYIDELTTSIAVDSPW
jgi:hypothetical protein